MTVQAILDDPEFRHLYLRVNARAVRYTFKAAPAGLPGILVTVPPHYDVADVRRAVETMRPRLRILVQKNSEDAAQHHIDWDFHIGSDCLQVSVVPGVGQRFQYRHDEGEFKVDGDRIVVIRPAQLRLLCPPDCDFDKEGRQDWLAKVLTEGIRMHAKGQLPVRMSAIASYHQIALHDIKVNASQSHWGSCAVHRQRSVLHTREYYNVNLSIYTLLLPLPVQRLILLHELCHTRHMDHSPSFHHDLDSWLGGEEQALEQQLRHYRTGLWSFVD